LLRELMAGRDFDAGTPISALRALLGPRSLIMLQGERHAARRERVAALFRSPAARQCEWWMVEEMRREAAQLDRHSPFSVYGLVQRVSLRAILAALFGVAVAEQREAERLVQRFLRSFRSPLVLFLKPLRIDAGPLSPWGRAMRNRQDLCAFIRRQMDAHRGTDQPTMLAQLLAAPGSDPWDDEDIVEEILSLLLFGHDTGAAAMAWALAHIYSDPAAAEAAEQEARDWQGRGSCDPDELVWVQACMRESMRLCPVVVHLSRRAVCDTHVGGIPVARGELVIPSTYVAQRNPAVFAEPNAFRPERFVEGRRYEGSYFPYGFGKRTCVGKPFVSRQMPLLIAALLASARLRLATGYAPHPVRQMVLIVPRSGTLLEFRRPSESMVSQSVSAS
jgi:cytochrome P450